MKRFSKLSDEQIALLVLIGVWLIGILCIQVYALARYDGAERAAAASLGVLIALAACSVGGLIGAVFGLPLFKRGIKEEGPSSPPAAGQEPTLSKFQHNTSLEDISDWLTKMLVGVGLTQLTSLPKGLSALAKYLGDGMAQTTNDQVMAGVTAVYSAICGFWIAYLWARCYMPGALRRSEIDAINDLRNQVAEQQRQLAEQQRQIAEQQLHDATALSLINRQLGQTNEPEVPQDQLDQAVSKASTLLQVQIFDAAREARKEGWQFKKCENIARTIRVFKALVACDKAEEHYRSHAEIGFALKDLILYNNRDKPIDDVQQLPAWKEAEKEFTQAIEIRDRKGGSERRSGTLEGNRAICRIRISELGSEQERTPELEAGIRADLKVAHQSKHEWVFEKDPRAPDWLIEYQISARWLKAHKLTRSDL